MFILAYSAWGIVQPWGLYPETGCMKTRSLVVGGGTGIVFKFKRTSVHAVANIRERRATRISFFPIIFLLGMLQSKLAGADSEGPCAQIMPGIQMILNKKKFRPARSSRCFPASYAFHQPAIRFSQHFLSPNYQQPAFCRIEEI